MQTLRLPCLISAALAMPTLNCDRGGALAGPTGADATAEARADSDSSDTSSSSSSSGPASDAELDATAEGGEASASAADGPADGAGEVGPEALCEGPPCPTPVFCPPGGNLGLASMGVTITTPGFPHAIIYYTTDGTLPTHTSAVYTAPILVIEVEAIHAIAFEPCVCGDSILGTASFSALPPTDGEVADCAPPD